MSRGGVEDRANAGFVTQAEGEEGEPDFSHLGLSLAFSAAYINGVMQSEHREIRQQWAKVREFLLNAKSHGPADAGWISVKDRLPKRPSRVLVAYRKAFNAFRPEQQRRQVYEARYSGGAWRFLAPPLKNRKSDHVTHWMPMPKYPSPAATGDTDK